MSRKIKWNSEKYRIALLGDELPGLRFTAYGFEASDGFDLRYIDKWSASQKRKVRTMYARMNFLLAQEKIIVKPRSEARLKKLQESFHGDVPSRGFKAAFVPFTTPNGFSNAGQLVPKVSYRKDGISISVGNYTKTFIPFDKVALAKDAKKEVHRAMDEMPDARLFFVQVGEFRTLNAKDRGKLTELVLHYMNKYDGIKPIPRGSGNHGDDPKWHHWEYWLDGVVGYSFPKKIDFNAMAVKISEGMREAKNRRADQDKVMKSTKGSKRKKSTKGSKRKK